MENSRRIGGWLMLLFVQIFLHTIYLVYGISGYLKIFTSNKWASFSLSSPKIKLIKELAYFEFGFFIVSLLFIPLLIKYFILRLKRFKDIYIVYLVFTLLGHVVIYLFAENISPLSQNKLQQITNIIFSILGWTVIWTLYLFKGRGPIIHS
jgi:hypothetical protein